MTDNEIIEALECCSNGEPCTNCPYQKQCDETDLAEIALDLINRQKAEIESKNDLIHRQSDVISEQKEKLESIYAEAVKEFAERLKENFNNLEYNARTTRKTVKTDELREQMDWVLHMVAPKTIDNLVKEMVGEG